MAHPLRFGVKNSGQDTTIDELRAVWRIADEARFDHVWVFDHLASVGPDGPDRPVYESSTLQAAMAVATRHVGLGCMVTGNTYRNPALQAKIAASVDHLSGGRLEFGIGAAWAEVEHQMFAIAGLDHRVGRLSESLEILRSLWTKPRTTFEGRYYTMRDAISNPKPMQHPYPPIWIGASGPRTLMLTARHADVWNASGIPKNSRNCRRDWTSCALRLAAIHQRSAAPCSTRGTASTAQSWWIPPADAPGAGFPSTSSLCPCATRSV